MGYHRSVSAVTETAAVSLRVVDGAGNAIQAAPYRRVALADAVAVVAGAATGFRA